MSATYCLHGYDWDPVATGMADEAQDKDDMFLSTVADHVNGLTITHAPDGSGCYHCRGVAVELCGEWASAQRIMLAWLMRKAGLV